MSKHKIVSWIKSGIRILGCIAGIEGMKVVDMQLSQWLLIHAFGFLLLAEIVGIWEERFEK